MENKIYLLQLIAFGGSKENDEVIDICASESKTKLEHLVPIIKKEFEVMHNKWRTIEKKIKEEWLSKRLNIYKMEKEEFEILKTKRLELMNSFDNLTRFKIANIWGIDEEYWRFEIKELELI
jgi:hypothetical protein